MFRSTLSAKSVRILSFSNLRITSPISFFSTPSGLRIDSVRSILVHLHHTQRYASVARLAGAAHRRPRCVKLFTRRYTRRTGWGRGGDRYASPPDRQITPPSLRGQVPSLHGEVGPPAPDGGRRSLETHRLGGQLPDDTREVGHGSPGEAAQQAELPLRGGKEEFLDDEAASRTQGEGGVVPEDDAQRPVGTGAQGVSGEKLCPLGGREDAPLARAGGLAFGVAHDAADLLGGGGKGPRPDGKPN